MVHIKKIWLLFLLVCTSCMSFSSEPNYIKLSNKISKNFIIEMETKYNIKYAGGGGAFATNVKEIALTFMVLDPLTLSQGRRLYIELVEELLKRYNSNEEIIPYLNNYPFTYMNTEIDLIFKCRNPQPDTPTLCSISLSQKNGFIYYEFVGSENSFKRLNDEGLTEPELVEVFYKKRNYLPSSKRIRLIPERSEAWYFETYEEALEQVQK